MQPSCRHQQAFFKFAAMEATLPEVEAKRPRRTDSTGCHRVREQVVSRGWAHVPGVLEPGSHALTALLAQIRDELVHPSVPPE
eukprot:COSAG05_NODE_105_length_18793_cov_115.346421_1_plen_83_part_00